MHKALKAGFAVGIAGSLALVVSLTAGVRLPVWLQLLAAFSLLSAFVCLYLAENIMAREERQVLDLGETVDELLRENHKARKAMADIILMGQLRAAFSGRAAHRTGPQSLLCPACGSLTCPGIRGVELCPEWRAAEERNARGEYLQTRPVWPVEATDDPEETTP